MPINRVKYVVRPRYGYNPIDEEIDKDGGHFCRNILRPRSGKEADEIAGLLNAAHQEGIRLGYAAAVEQARRMIGDMNLAGLADLLIADHFKFDQIEYHTRPDRTE